MSFMALTSHFLLCDDSGHLRLDNRLLAFQVVDGKHDGKNIAKIIFDILKEAHLLMKVRAAVCDTFFISYIKSHLAFADWPVHFG